MPVAIAEFKANVVNGVIEIPAELKGQISGRVDIVVYPVADEKTVSETPVIENMIEHLIKNPIKFDGKFLTRDEIYDRR